MSEFHGRGYHSTNEREQARQDADRMISNLVHLVDGDLSPQRFDAWARENPDFLQALLEAASHWVQGRCYGMLTEPQRDAVDHWVLVERIPSHLEAWETLHGEPGTLDAE
jgi:hypothetical protein